MHSRVLQSACFQAAACVLAAQLTLAGETPRSEPIDEAQLDFRDNDDGRRDADIRAVLEQRDGEVVLRVVSSAVGPSIEPVRGYRGRSGSNRITAEEIASLLKGRRLSVESRRVGADQVIPGIARAGRSGRVPERRIGADGRIDFEALSALEYPLELVVEIKASGSGLHEALWLVDGSPRLKVAVQVGEGGGRIVSIEAIPPDPALAVESIVELDPGERAVAAITFLALKPAEDTPTPVDIAEWERRDLEGRWVLLKDRLAAEPARGEAWVAFLASRRELELLEWLAIYGERASHSLDITGVLYRENAPQWLRVSAWLHQAVDSHSRESAEKVLLTRRPGHVLAWLKKHPELVEGGMGSVYKKLVALSPPPADISGALPPLDPRAVLAHLDAPPVVEDFGERKQSEPGKVYVHQVVRAIDGLVASVLRDKAWLEKLFALTGHSNHKVRQAAYLAYTSFPSELIPREAFRAVVFQDAEPPAIREAALLAYSYAVHPKVYLDLHAIALEPRHAGWKAAVSRLGDVGDGFTLGLLEPALKEKAGASASLVDAELARIRERVRGQGPAGVAHSLGVRLERAAWADVTCNLLEVHLVPWTLESVQKHARDAKVRAALEKIQSSFEPSARDEPWGLLVRTRVREYAKRLLESP